MVQIFCLVLIVSSGMRTVVCSRILIKESIFHRICLWNFSNNFLC
ncbi:hypothetical protein GLYMA_13G051251v4 [Glycine max]|nr:hypothetical protein GLYMA_13G051251v4 [Glycine max]KAH1099933.1 hypothetical protein GYH30_035196 [Glycine max]